MKIPGSDSRVLRQLSRYRSLPVFIGILLGGILGYHSLFSLKEGLFLLIFIVSSVMVPLYVYLPIIKKFIFRIVVYLCLSFCYSNIYQYLNAPNSLPYKLPSGIEAELKVEDQSACGSKISWLSNPWHLRARLMRFRYSVNSEWIESDACVSLRMPKQSKTLEFGDILRVSGVLRKAELPLFAMSFNEENYLSTHGFDAVLTVHDFKLIGNHKSLLNKAAIDLRNILMSKAVLGVAPEYKPLIAAMFFGCRQGISQEMKSQFINNGIIHILAISGLHMGIIALIASILLCFLPFRIKYIVLPILLMLYMFIIGFHVSAFRAVVMFSCWSFSRAMLKKYSTLDIIFLAASILFFVNPLIFLDIGFQYSFSVVFFLIISWQAILKLQQQATESLDWIPHGDKNFKYIAKRVTYSKTITAFLSCSIAWISSSFLTLFYRGTFVVHALGANMILMPLLPFIFIIVAIKIIVPSFLNPPIIFLINRFFDLFLYITQKMSDIFEPVNIGQTSCLLVVLGFFALLFLIKVQNLRVQFASMTILLLVFSIILFLSPADSLCVINNSDPKKPVVVEFLNRADKANLYGLTSTNSMYIVKDLLSSNGIEKIELQNLSKRNKKIENYLGRYFNIIESFQKKGMNYQVSQENLKTGETILTINYKGERSKLCLNRAKNSEIFVIPIRQ